MFGLAFVLATATSIGALVGGSAAAVALHGSQADTAPSYLTYRTQVHLLGPRAGIVPPRNATAQRTTPNAPAADALDYGGGPVQHNPKVYLIFWGSQWNNDSAGVIPYLKQFFQGTGNSDSWTAIMDQYCDGAAQGASSCGSGTRHVSFNGGVYAGTWLDDTSPAPSNASGDDLAAEATAGAKHFGNTTSSSNANAQYVVLSPHGTHPDGFPNSNFCAWHTATDSPYGTLSFSNDPYMPDGSCGTDVINSGSRGYLDGFSIVGGHEFAESVTDPQPSSGWVDSSGEEIGDLCSWVSSGPGAMQNITLSTGTFAVQGLWSNSARGCAISGGTLGGSSGEVHAVGAGKCLDVPGSSTTSGTQLDIRECSGASNQEWTQTSGGSLTVYSGSSRECLAADGGAVVAGTKAVIAPCDSSSGQHWKVNSNGTITGVGSGLCLDVTGAKTADGTGVEIWTCNGGSNQQWTLG
jgi:hypothetical protein